MTKGRLLETLCILNLILCFAALHVSEVDWKMAAQLFLTEDLHEHRRAEQSGSISSKRLDIIKNGQDS